MLSDSKQDRVIKGWSRSGREDNPALKLLENGPANLTDSELLAIIIGGVTRNGTSIEIANDILISVQHNLYDLGRLSVRGLQHFKGIGKAKALALRAALELGKRRYSMEHPPVTNVKRSEDAFKLMFSELSDKQYEEFWILLLNRSNRMIAKRMISRGGVSGTLVDAKIIFKYAIESLACSLILVHNHPSGHLKPSAQDIQLTRKLIKAGSLLDVQILDHLIIGRGSYLSMADEGLID